MADERRRITHDYLNTVFQGDWIEVARRLHAEIDWAPEIPIKQTLADLLAYWVAKLRKNDANIYM